jgi:hypothetical protein
VAKAAVVESSIINTKKVLRTWAFNWSVLIDIIITNYRHRRFHFNAVAYKILYLYGQYARSSPFYYNV